MVVYAQRRRQTAIPGDLAGRNQLTHSHKSTDQILEELLNNPEPDRPLRGHEIARILFLGRIEPGEYRYETGYMDGSVEIETFTVDEDGQVKDLKIWREGPNNPTSELTSRERKGRRSTKRTAEEDSGRNDR